MRGRQEKVCVVILILVFLAAAQSFIKIQAATREQIYQLKTEEANDRINYVDSIRITLLHRAYRRKMMEVFGFGVGELGGFPVAGMGDEDEGQGDATLEG